MARNSASVTRADPNATLRSIERREFESRFTPPGTRHAKKRGNSSCVLQERTESRVELKTLYNFYMQGNRLRPSEMGATECNVGPDVATYESFKTADVKRARE